ncbi:cyanoexosortase B system-associated protein [Sphaerospermopsis aphanizomenoides BCCUSP55]|uniref:cyanoexosortase B system-associated protein n=1 Tax=Sphaerospermopsis aphanizomenoides TaxID=459663 RepID=UPI0019075EC1|nr:cyanoexosortase B system-associated protein [Sphaerospermopsis aphanizomenoides]MBK1990452.1 cyanoexosortase B system-associated protein [Sphaerospermopsis aphanizomenoides BCCUSP55]
MSSLSKLFQEKQRSQVVVLILLLLLLVVGAVPGYLTGKWPWQQPPSVAKLNQLKNIRKVGLNIPDWQTIQQSESQIGEHKWSLQILKQKDPANEAILLLLPQNGPRDQPEVEWIDVSGWGKTTWGKWDMAQYRTAEFTVKKPASQELNSTTKVQSRFFRATTQKQTFAVLQWYAMPNEGTISPVRWFVSDQVAQWQKKRVPWVAVSILMPMESFGEAETNWSKLQSLGEKVQTELMSVAL